ncbi:hypothetical protein ACFODZ_16965 [Marinicella sediminis]|uniref:Uncharacterized protein n=1 Tax=Marinicella sediminis TaxID=1792834 RepID=A0ABV7JCU2_9GAMM|nr:hypothetical protein [Marinicella sediminis]
MITTNFDKLSFHDASIEKIDRKPGEISIEFEGAFLSKEHPDSKGEDWVIESGVLHLLNVTDELPLFWYDDKEGKPHPSPDFPIDEVMNLDFNGDTFEFGGFLNREPWVQWVVNATGFKIEIKGSHSAYS